MLHARMVLLRSLVSWVTVPCNIGYLYILCSVNLMPFEIVRWYWVGPVDVSHTGMVAFIVSESTPLLVFSGGCARFTKISFEIV